MTASRASLPSPQSQERRAPPDFDRLARLYRWMELITFGPWLERCRFSFLGDLASCRRALVLGDGDGRFTARLTSLNPLIEVDAVDASSAMLRELLRRAGSGAARVQAHCADARLWQPANPPYDLAATHFFLDCLTGNEVRFLAKRMRSAMLPSAPWVLSEFATPGGVFGRWVARPLVWLLYRAFGLLTGLSIRTLPDHSSALRAAGFALRERRTFLCGLLAAEIWTAL